MSLDENRAFGEQINWRVRCISKSSPTDARGLSFTLFSLLHDLLSVQNFEWFYSRRPLQRPLMCGKWLAAHGRVDGIEDGQALDIRHATNGDRIGEMLDFALRVGERRPRGEARPVRIARLREVGPLAGHLLSQLPICCRPAPGRPVEVVEDIPELGEVARAPTRVH